MSGPVVALVGIMMTFIIAVVGWLILSYKKVRDDAEEKTTILETQEEHQREIKDLKDMVRTHDNYFKAIEIRMAEFGGLQRTVYGIQSDVKEIDKKMDEREISRNDKMERMMETIHEIHIKVTENSK